MWAVFPRFGVLRQTSFLSPPSLLFPRIPHFWSADHIYSVAVKLGPVDTEKLKFSLEELERITVAASPSLTEEPARPLRRPSTEKNLSECEVLRGVSDIRQMY